MHGPLGGSHPAGGYGSSCSSLWIPQERREIAKRPSEAALLASFLVKIRAAGASEENRITVQLLRYSATESPFQKHLELYP
jgi:hypothetical protein